MALQYQAQLEVKLQQYHAQEVQLLWAYPYPQKCHPINTFGLGEDLIFDIAIKRGSISNIVDLFIILRFWTCVHFIGIAGYIETGTCDLFKWGNKEIKCFEEGP